MVQTVPLCSDASPAYCIRELLVLPSLEGFLCTPAGAGVPMRLLHGVAAAGSEGSLRLSERRAKPSKPLSMLLSVL